MILTDLHTHSTFSLDGRSSLEDMVQAAKHLGVKYYGISEHFDLDEYSINLYGGVIDEGAYFFRARQLQNQYNDENFTFLVGGEFNYFNDKNVHENFCRIIERYRPDFIVNSVHVVDGNECYRPEYFAGKSKQYAYSRYLEQVLKSLNSPFRYDIVGHVGYVSRNAPFPDRKLIYADFKDIYDEILKTVIEKGVILEVNSSTRGAGSDCLPDIDVLKAYFSLGGKKISFGSDAHWTQRIADNREHICTALKQIGFTHITVPVCGKHIQVEI